MQKIIFKDRQSADMNDAFGITEERANEMFQALDDMVDYFIDNGMIATVPDVVAYIQDNIAKSMEEFIWCFTSHVLFAAKHCALKMKTL